MATLALRHAATPSIKQLRNMNMYVKAAMSDWHSKYYLNAHSPLQTSPCSLNGSDLPGTTKVIAGTASFGMSGVNANALVQQTSNFDYYRLEAIPVTSYTVSQLKTTWSVVSVLLHVLL